MAGDDVFLGQWTNWSRGPLLGPTLTMTQENGKYLIAFIAFFVAFVATRFWRICCFFLHRFHSTNDPSAAPYHQRQAILRNSSSPESGLVSLIRLCWAWRQPRLVQLLALLSPAIVAFIVLAGFALAGVFSSQISSTAGNEVLLTGAKCGIMIGTTNITDHLKVVGPYQSRVVENAFSYAQQCYSSSDSSMVDCSRFVAPRLAVGSVDTSAGCPFEMNMCQVNGSNLRIDSGYIDSNRDLGMNTDADERFMWRTVLHCAPLATEGHSSNVTNQNGTFIRYHYGRTLGFNYTYQVKDLAQQYPDLSEDTLQEPMELMLNSVTSYVVNGSVDATSAFEASPDLQRPDADTSIIFLVGNGVVFSEQTRDDWYRASTIYGKTGQAQSSDDESAPIYRMDEAASPLGCVSQYQYCIVGQSGERQCGPLSGIVDYMTNAARAFGIADENLTSDRISSSSKKGSRFSWTAGILDHSVGMEITNIVGHLGPRSLDSQTGLSQGMQGPLSVDQWKNDVTRWYNSTMAAIQAAFTGTARGISDPGFDNCTGCLSPAINTYEERMCRNQVRSSTSLFGSSRPMLTREQKILSTAYASFSLFGLYFTFVTGLAIVLLSYSLELIFEYVHKHGKQCDKYRYLEWTSHSVLQLQRQGHEALGLGAWEKCTEEVPICRPDEIMGVLDIMDGSHPILRHPSFDGQVPGVEPNKAAQTAEASVGNHSADRQDGRQGNREQHPDQTAYEDDTSHGESDTLSLENTTMASTPELNQPESSAPSAESADEEVPSPIGTMAPSAHMDQGSPPTTDGVERTVSD